MAKDPRKVARDVIRELGGRVSGHSNHGTYYVMPDGARLHVGNNEHMGTIARTLDSLRERYGHVRREAWERYDSSRRRPTLDLEKLRASDHAKERLRLMQSQRKVTFADVLHCLRIPEKVLFSEQHNSWLWLRGDLAVAVADIPDGHLITTVLWSRNELFEAHPRPA